MDTLKYWPWVAICVPVYKWPPHPKFLESIDRCEKDPRFHVKTIYVTGDANIDSARSRILAEYLQYEHPYDWYCQLDADIEIEPDDLWRMINRNVNVIGAAYAFKCDGPKANQPVVRLLDKAEPTNGLLRVTYLGGGCTFVKDSFLKKMCVEDLKFNLHPDQPGDLGLETYALWNPLIINQPAWGDGKKELLSEDWAFCHRISLMQEPIWLDLTVVLGHWDKNKCYRLQCS